MRSANDQGSTPGEVPGLETAREDPPEGVRIMRARMTDGVVVEAVVTTDHAASSYGLPVLVVNGEALGTADAAGVAIVEATAEERDDLRRAGYRMTDDGGGPTG